MLIKDKNIFMFSENYFYNNWLKNQNETTNTNDILINYNLALENIEDLQYISSLKENLELIDEKKLTSLTGAENYAFLLIYYIENEFRAYVKTSIANKEVDKNFNLKTYPKNETKTFDEGIKIIKEEIIQIWKSQNLIDVNTPSFLNLFLDNKRTNDYLNFSNILESLDVIENYSVLEMTNERIKIRIKYKGKISKLRKKLAENKIKIVIVDNVWKATIN